MKLDNRTKELIAIGASITANCQPCLKYHISKAIENGAEEYEIKEAIEIGKLVRKGSASKMDIFTATLNISHGVTDDEKPKEEECNTESGCCKN